MGAGWDGGTAWVCEVSLVPVVPAGRLKGRRVTTSTRTKGGDGHGAGMDLGEGSGVVTGPGCADKFRCACQSDRRGERAAGVEAGTGYPVSVNKDSGTGL